MKTKKKPFKPTKLARCSKCQCVVAERNGKFTCCGVSVPTKRRRVKSLDEIVTGYRHESLGTGEALYDNGRLIYMDDGNGNEYNEGDEDDDCG